MSAENERYAKLAAKLLISSRAEEVPFRSQINRDALVASMVSTIENKSRNKRIYWIGTTLALAACAIFAIRFGVRSSTFTNKTTSGDVITLQELVGKNRILHRHGGWQPATNNLSLVEGDEIVVPEGASSVLSFPDGTRARIRHQSRVEITQLGSNRRLTLQKGHMDLQVAKLGPLRRFQVTTPDASVEVHGTTFSVSVGKTEGGCGAIQASTFVKVNEGLVSVKYQGGSFLLHEGDVWPCDSTKKVPVDPTLESAITTVPPRPLPSGRSAKLPSRDRIEKRTLAPVTSVVVPPNLSNLKAQNDLFQEALQAERQQDMDHATHLLNTLIERYPGGPLEESARAELLKIRRLDNR
jgi:hypothetical protein